MIKSENTFLPDFSHIYVESEAKKYNLTRDCLDRFPNANIIEISDYKSFFNRKNQDFQTQKKSIKLILAVKKPPFIYKSTDILQDGGFKNFYYNTPILNCLYNCDYCFLQGMYPSANIVVFVNQNDMKDAVDEKLLSREYPKDPLALSISYNTDLMAFENILPITRSWINFANTKSDLLIEVRTKSALFNSFSDLSPSNKIIFSWTLSPERVVRKNEFDTPPLERRLSAIQLAISKGWKIRLCFDPVLIYKNWEKDYSDLLDKIIYSVAKNKIYDITVGVFRMGQDYFQRVRKSRPKSIEYYKNYVEENKIMTVSQEQKDAVRTLFTKKLKDYISKDKIHFWI